MVTSPTFSASFLRSLLPPDTNIIRPRIYFRVKTTEIDNQYDLYSRTCENVSSIIEGVEFNVSYSPVACTSSLHIMIAIDSKEGLIIFVLDISNAFHSTILTNPAERVYLSLPHIYLDWYKS